uniref:KOW domain-containing protein n=1 Tax=Mycena chlorophos TaxID=658473 RepID=A0ABQ0L761_MYCCL|nr:predicted protein [Mycena chlorophos]
MVVTDGIVVNDGIETPTSREIAAGYWLWTIKCRRSGPVKRWGAGMEERKPGLEIVLVKTTERQRFPRSPRRVGGLGVSALASGKLMPGMPSSPGGCLPSASVGKSSLFIFNTRPPHKPSTSRTISSTQNSRKLEAPNANRRKFRCPTATDSDRRSRRKRPAPLTSSSAASWDHTVEQFFGRWSSVANPVVPIDGAQLPLFLPAPTDEASTLAGEDEITAVGSSSKSAPSLSSHTSNDGEPPRKRQRLRAHSDEAFLRFLDLSAAEANADSDSDEDESAADRRFINDEDDFEPDHSVVAANPLLFPDEPAGLPDDVDELHAISEALTAKYASRPSLLDESLSEVDETALKHAGLAWEYERVPASTFVPELGRVQRPRRGEKVLAGPPPIPTGENQFFLIYTRKNHEYDLLLHLFHTSCVASATAVGLGSGLVVAEIRPGELEWTREHLPAAREQSKLDWKKVRDGSQEFEVLRMLTYKYFCAQLSLFVTQMLNRWERRGPKAISGFEAQSFIRSRCGTSDRISSRVAARWIRFRSGDHAGHLGLLQANPSANGNEPDEWDEILIIPSLGGGRNDEERLCLFDTKHVNAERRNKTFIWCERRFTEGGLEIVGLRRVEPMPYDYDVVPRDAELAMFRRAHVNDQLDLPYIGHTGALQPGDLVVLPNDAPWGSRAGLIFKIRDIETVRDEAGNVRLSKEGDDPHSIKRIRYAWVIQPYDAPWSSSQVWKQRLEAVQTYAVPELRLHLLAFPRRIRPGDRVTSVSPNQMLGISAMVHQVDGPDVVVDHAFAPDDDLAQQTPVQTRIPLRLVFVQFKIGDVVRVIRGRHINKVGFVVAILPAGWIQFYPAEINEGKFVLVDAAQTNIQEARPAPDPAADHAAMQLDFDVEITSNRLVVEADPIRGDAASVAPVIFVPGTHLAFEQFDPNDYRDYQVRRSDQALPSATLERERAKLRREMRKDAVPWLHNIPVRVVGTHPLKGLYGDVQGYSWTIASPSKITNIFERYEKLVITVALDRANGGNKREQIPYKHLAHRGSGLPLYTTSLVKSLAKAMVFDRIQTVPSVDVPLCEARYGPPPSLDDILSLRFLVNNASFVNKRLDVRVATEKEFADTINHWRQPGLAQRSKGKDALCGIEGYLKPLDKPLTDRQWNNMAKIFVGPGQTKYVPYPLLFPRRTVKDSKFEGHIGTFEHVRVIVIGPAVGGSKEWMGKYGRVVLDTPTEWPTRVLTIEFPPCTGSRGLKRELFYEESLCLASNTRIPGNPDTEVTSWEVKKA